MRTLKLEIWNLILATALFFGGSIGVIPGWAEEATPAVAKPIYSVTVIPNPVRGKKVNFRVLTGKPIKVNIRVYDRFLDTVIELEKEGDKLFDVLWSLKKVPEGFYYFQAQITDTKTGEITPLAVQKFVVLKENKPIRK